MAGDVVDQLLHVCDELTTRALSCRTFGKTQQQQRHGSIGDEDNNVIALIQKEKEMEAWLQRQIMDYRVRLSVLQHREVDYSTTSHDNDDRFHQSSDEIISRLQGEIFDESVKIQQERLLFHRIAMATPAIQAIREDEDDTTEPRKSQRVLIKQALRERDDKTQQVLSTIRTLNELEMEIQNGLDDSQHIREKCRLLMNELKSQRSIQTGVVLHGDPKIGVTSMDLNREDESWIAKENLMLRRAMLDLIVEGKLDWYSDDRLSNTLLKLERN